MKWFVLVIVAVIAFLVVTSKAMPEQNKNNSAERMRKLRAIKKKKAEERNRAQMKAVA